MSNVEPGKHSGDRRSDETLTEAARHEAADVAEAAASAARDLARDAEEAAVATAEQGRQRAAGQLERFASALQTSTGELGPDDAWLAEIVHATANQLKSASRHLHDQDLRGLAREASGFARKHPAAFLGASVALGFAAARLAKAHDPGGGTTVDSGQTRTRQGAAQ